MRRSLALGIGLALLAGSARAGAADLSTMIRGLDPDGMREDFASLLWSMGTDEERAAEVLARADRDVASLTDSLLSFVSMTEPEARARMDSLDVARDDVLPDDRAPRWADLQWAGVRLLRALAPDRTEARDIRLLRDLEEAMAPIATPRPAAVRGVVQVWRRWWADRGEDPTLTHDPTRIPDLTPWMLRLEAAADDPDAWRAPRLLADLDDDLVLRVRVAARIDPERHAFLAAELVASLRTFPEGFVEAGIAPRTWNPQIGRTEGHRAGDLWEIALEFLERAVGRPFSGPDDDGRRLAALGWWEGAQYEARYWRDPRAAPSLDRFLDGLHRDDGTPIEAARWARTIYLERGIQDVVLDRLDRRHEGTVAELIALLAMPKEQAHAAGFAMAYRSDVVDQPGVTRRVAIDWDRARAFLRQLLEHLTGAREPEGVAALSPGAQASFWADWWATHRDDPRWSREGFATPGDATDARPRFESLRGRID